MTKCDTSPYIPPDIACDVPLFVKDHHTTPAPEKSHDLTFDDSYNSTSNSSHNNLRPRKPADILPSLASSAELPETFLSLSVSDRGLSDRDNAADINNGGVDLQECVPLRDNSVSSSSIGGAGASLGLPDFLSDGAILGNRSTSNRGQPKSRDDDLHSQIRIVSNLT